MTHQQSGSPSDPIQRFLCLCLRSRWDADAYQTAQAMRHTLDTSVLYWTARLERLTPLLYETARGRDLVPGSLESRLRRDYGLNALRNMFLLSELEDLLLHTSRAQIPVIILKGAVLAETVYPDAATRPMVDLDLLVHRQDMPAMLAELERLGYIRSHIEAQAGITAKYENEILLSKRNGVEVKVEVHWSLIDSPYYQNLLPMDWFWRTAQRVKVGNAVALAFGPEAQILHLCAHLALHHGEQGLLWLHDIAAVILFYRAQIDWKQILKQAQAFHLVLPLQRVLPKIAEEWQVPIPDGALAQLRALSPSSEEARAFIWLSDRRAPVIQRFWADLVGMAGWRQRLHYAWAHLFPSPAYMQQRYHIRHPVLTPLYYPFRWVLGLRGLLQT